MTCGPDPGSLDPGEKAIILATAGLAVVVVWLLMLDAHQAAHLPVSSGDALASAFMPDASKPAYLSLAGMWGLMTVAMMLPPTMPWILFYASASRNPQDGEVRWRRVALFTAGYLAVWLLFGLAAALAQFSLGRTGLLAGVDGGRLSLRLTGGLVLLAAGAYQLSPLKAACLRHCRTPLSYFLQSWRDGPMGGFSMGAGHGLYCMGCCWALMAVSFSVGVMNLLWMAVLTLFLTIEKTAPHGVNIGRAVGVGLILWGLGMALWA